MREIKFRAWNNKTNKMGFDESMGDILCEKEYDKPHLVIMQFTGLKDKKGKEIYEGDIIEQIFYGDEISKIMLVVEDIRNLESIRCGSSKENKIIGNIYENPEFTFQKKEEPFMERKTWEEYTKEEKAKYHSLTDKEIDALNKDEVNKNA